jgi:hypothetical protein
LFRKAFFLVVLAGACALASLLAIGAAFSSANDSVFGLAFGQAAMATQAGEKGTADGAKTNPAIISTKPTSTATATTNAATATTNAATTTKGSTSESEINATAEPPSDSPQRQPKATLTIRLYVPQMLKRTDTFCINPFTTPPPKIAIQVFDLPENGPGLKQKIMNKGYNNRQSFIKPYSDGGWRWQYAYQHALKRSGITEPHIFFQMYNFAEDLYPWVLPEVKRINKIEKERLKTYYALITSYTDNHKDEEMDALRLGLEPVKLNLLPIKKGGALETSLYISPGDWWITGTHKIPGLIYFWQEPVKIHDGDKLTVELTDANAILIQGGW